MQKIQFKDPEQAKSQVKKVATKPKIVQLTMSKDGKMEKPQDFVKISKSEYTDEVKEAINSMLKKQYQKYQLKVSDWCECECGNHEGCCMNGCELKLATIECKLGSHDGVDCGNQRMQRKQFAKTVVGDAGLKGRGLFANEHIKKGQLILEYIGEVISKHECELRLKEANFYAIELIRDRAYIDASRKGNDARYINHSCNPNCEALVVGMGCCGEMRRIGLYAVKDIQLGEEICFDYNYKNWNGIPQVCYCGEPNCTGWMDKELRKADKQ